MRTVSENERKRLIISNEKQVDWYKLLLSKLVLLASNGEDMAVCHLLTDAIRQELEDGR